MGVVYSTGLGVPKNTKQAIEWYRKAAQQGVGSAQFNLGIIYDQGKGTPQDYKQAFYWFLKAAEQGVADAQHNVGSMYALGQGTPQNHVKSYTWYSVAAANGYEQSSQARDNAAQRLTPEQLAKGQELAASYFEKYQPK